MKDIDTQAFWNSMIMGLTAQEYVNRMLEKVRPYRHPAKASRTFVSADYDNKPLPENFPKKEIPCK
jgi:hypothetical protein